MAERKSTGGSRARRYPRGRGWLAIAPTVLPAFQVMFDDIGASPARLARHLGCGRTAIYRWLDGAPCERRAYELAMFYETKWGRDFIATEAHNDARLFGSAMLALRAENDRLTARLARLGHLGDFGSANDPAEGVPTASTPALRRLALEALTTTPERARRRA
jgi:hypothetical protein